MFKCQGFWYSAQRCAKNQKCDVYVEAHPHKSCPKKESKKPECVNCMGLRVASYKSCPAYKEQTLRQHVVQQQISYASVLKQAPPLPWGNTYSFSTEQFVSLVTNMVLKVALPQFCNKSLPEKLIQAKSELSNQIAETASTISGVNIEGKEVFESIISRPAPPAQPPLLFPASS